MIFDDCFVFFLCVHVCAGAPTLSTAVSATSVWLTLTTTASGSTPASDQETIGRKKLYHRTVTVCCSKNAKNLSV